MYQELTISFQRHLATSHPDLLAQLQDEGELGTWLTEKIDAVIPIAKQLRMQNTPAFIIMETCMHELVKQLPVSRFNYISSVLEEEFEADYFRLSEMGVLTYEVLNMMEACAPVLDAMAFSADNEDNPNIHYAVTGALKDYLDSKQVSMKM
ncbi:MAG: hypothetical protein BGO55_08760 [Sphingobacteriales bacterium 50-39]|nr:hypothetical protein [Sphingobacteriales bacterium]OJW59353.1 MAG: hypothetical protein BGO55_08760 [Sphingobacteriales bacterium 50-39]